MTSSVSVELKRVQTFLFTVPALREMLGANALLGETVREELVKLASGAALPDSMTSVLTEASQQHPADPLNTLKKTSKGPTANQLDNPQALLKKGILSREGGHFTAVFPDDKDAELFADKARAELREHRPGLLFTVSKRELGEEKGQELPGADSTTLVELPIFQVCTASGRDIASKSLVRPGNTEYVSEQVRMLRWAGWRFRRGQTNDMVGLLTRQGVIGQHGAPPETLEDLTGGGYLALIHADGNGLGKRFNCWRDPATPGSIPGKDPVSRLRQEVRNEKFFHGMRVAVRQALVKAIAETFDHWSKNPAPCPYQVLMLGGDDLLLACRAQFALPFLISYARALENFNLPEPDGKPLSIGAGVAIAAQNFPFHRLHALAEALASSAKRRHRARQDGQEISVIDWMVITNSWADDPLAERQRSHFVRYRLANGSEETLALSGRPYPILGEGLSSLDGLWQAAKKLREQFEDKKATGKPQDRGRDKKQVARSQLRDWLEQARLGRRWAEEAFADLDDATRKVLKDQLKDQAGSVWKKVGDNGDLTCLPDLIELYEIANLGRGPSLSRRGEDKS